MVATLIALTLAAPPDLVKAQKLFDRAQYEKALKALGERCDDEMTRRPCERLRGFVMMALGDEGGARAAFVRWLAEEPEASLGPDVSPKLQALFGAVKREVLELRELTVEPLRLRAGESTWVFRVDKPEVELDGLALFVALPGRESFARVDLRREGDAYTGSASAPAEDGEARYYLVADLSGVPVASGSESAPRSLTVRLAGSAPPPPNGGETSPFDMPGLGAPVPAGDPLPGWALGAMIGGGVVVVAVGVTLALLLTGGSDPGQLEVTVTFRD